MGKRLKGCAMANAVEQLVRVVVFLIFDRRGPLTPGVPTTLPNPSADPDLRRHFARFRPQHVAEMRATFNKLCKEDEERDSNHRGGQQTQTSN